LGPFKVVLTDFERTLVRLFEDAAVEKEFLEEVWTLCSDKKRFHIPTRVLKAGGESPYSVWTKAHGWMTRHRKDALEVQRMYHAVARIAVKYEMEAAESVRLFDHVLPVLEQLKKAGVPVVIVSNNAAEAVERIVKESNAESLVHHVVGRDFRYEWIGNLKPKPTLLFEALKHAGRGPGRPLLVGDSVDDMKAGRRARIGYRVALLEHSTASRWQLRRAGARLVLHRFGDLSRLLPGGETSGAG
jgi:HAD superfamily hydrolase (TIGR01549 family)